MERVLDADLNAPDIDGAPAPETANEPIQPRRRGRPPGAKNKASSAASSGARKSATWIRSQCASLVSGVNLAAAMIPQFIDREDLLTNAEMSLLTDALVAEANSSRRILSWLERAAGVSPHLLLVQAVIAIAVPRLRRRGILPGETESVDWGEFSREEINMLKAKNPERANDIEAAYDAAIHARS